MGVIVAKNGSFDSSSATVHADSLPDQMTGSTRCGRDGSIVKPTEREVTCKSCLKATALDQRKAESHAEALAALDARTAEYAVLNAYMAREEQRTGVHPVTGTASDEKIAAYAKRHHLSADTEAGLRQARDQVLAEESAEPEIIRDHAFSAHSRYPWQCRICRGERRGHPVAELPTPEAIEAQEATDLNGYAVPFAQRMELGEAALMIGYTRDGAASLMDRAYYLGERPYLYGDECTTHPAMRPGWLGDGGAECEACEVMRQAAEHTVTEGIQEPPCPRGYNAAACEDFCTVADHRAVETRPGRKVCDACGVRTARPDEDRCSLCRVPGPITKDAILSRRVDSLMDAPGMIVGSASYGSRVNLRDAAAGRADGPVRWRAPRGKRKIHTVRRYRRG